MKAFAVETEYFLIEACRDCALPGYLIVSSRGAEAAISDLPTPAQQALGPVLSAVVGTITKVLNAERVYTAHFSEHYAGLHFHLFPRTKEIGDAFRREHPDDHGIDGPKLLSWARRKYGVNPTLELPPETIQILAILRATLLGNQASEPTSTAVTLPAYVGCAPAPGVAHLSR